MSAHACAGMKPDVERSVAGNGPDRVGRNPGDTAIACSAGMSLDEYSGRIAEEMHRRIDLQRALIGRLLAEGAGSGPRESCPLVTCPRLSMLEGAMRETIEVLDATRSAFRSKRLEVLRKKLIEVLSGR